MSHKVAACWPLLAALFDKSAAMGSDIRVESLFKGPVSKIE